MKKKCTVVILPTNEKITEDSNLFFESEPTINQLFYVNSCGNRHLYILSDDKYKEGDWIFIVGKIAKASKINCSKQVFKKCIATTDPSLNLPRPSNEFIKKYCEKGGIYEVLVEYEEMINLLNETVCITKTAPDNTVSIYPIKENWNREEVIQLITNAWDRTGTPMITLDEWLKQNL